MEFVQGLLLALRAVLRFDGYPDGQFARLDHWIVAVLQDCYPLHCASRESGFQLFFDLLPDVVQRGPLHDDLRSYYRNQSNIYFERS
jgi:hypothetical protein